MHFIARNTNEMMIPVYGALVAHGVRTPSRNGLVRRLPGVTTMTYTHPMERVNFCPVRKINPFFHHLEAIWVLAGRRDTKMLDLYNKGMKQYSDDGVQFNAAYGHRMRHHFGQDQLHTAITVLRRDPDTRQAVIQLWEPNDLDAATRDKACNMSMVAEVVKGAVNLTVFNRSNDAVWGAVAGTNPVQFGYILQYIAEALQLRTGSLTVVSNNLHIYEDLPRWHELRAHYTKLRAPLHDKYEETDFAQLRLLGPEQSLEELYAELREFCILAEEGSRIHAKFKSPVLENISKKLHNVWVLPSDKRLEALTWDPTDWTYAAGAFLHRQAEKK